MVVQRMEDAQDENIIKYDPNSVLKLEDEEQKKIIETMKTLEVQKAGGGEAVKLEELWKESKNGLGSAKTAAKFADWLEFKGKMVTDPTLTTYLALGFEKQPEFMKGITAATDAGKLLEKTGVKSVSWLIGGGLTSALQNGGVICVNQEGTSIPFAYRSHGSWDIPEAKVMLASVAKE